MAGDDAVPDVGDLCRSVEGDLPAVEVGLAGRHVHSADESRTPVVPDAVGHRGATRRQRRGRRRTGHRERGAEPAGCPGTGVADACLQCRHGHRHGNRDCGGNPEIQMESGVADLNDEGVLPTGGVQGFVGGVGEVAGGIHDDRAVGRRLGDRVGKGVALGIGPADRSGQRVGLTGQNRLRGRSAVEQQPVDLPAYQRQGCRDEVQRTGRCLVSVPRRHHAREQGRPGDGGCRLGDCRDGHGGLRCHCRKRWPGRCRCGRRQRRLR